jgi:anti-anti-sigma regulatory factor
VTAPDLLAVDELCRLAATARQLGCRAHLVGADADLHALFELAGVADVLLRCPADHPIGPDPTRPAEALR